MTDYERCGRTKRDGSGDTCDLPAGWGTEHTGEGACKLHGGNTPRGEDNPAFKSGAWSKYVDYDDDVKAAVNATTNEGDVAVLEELRDERLARYYQHLKYLSESEGVSIAKEILDTIDAGQEVDAKMVKELAKVIGVSSSSMDNLIARIQSLTNDIADRRGEDPRTIREEQGLTDEAEDALDRLSDSLESRYGDD